MPDERRTEYPALAWAPAAARSDLADYLASEGRFELIPVAVLLVSELITNACLHATEPIVLRAGLAANTLHVEVDDCTRVSCDPCVRDGHGRGLQIVSAYATTWGHSQRDGSGRTSWFELIA